MARKKAEPVDETQVDTMVEANQEIMVAIPIGQPPAGGYEAKQADRGKVTLSKPTLHIDAQLGPDAAHAFLRMRNGLRDSGARLTTGRPVWTNVDALRWLMEQVSAEVA